ncbi:MAG TPA: hypothetical protein PLO67_10005 [Saprospiraceae bacterium]|nr:hypothetical protein [Saprospiraceae bacterium]HPI06220.1 hypothetical protein [Saprospiraceae bacterium]
MRIDSEDREFWIQKRAADAAAHTAEVIKARNIAMINESCGIDGNWVTVCPVSKTTALNATSIYFVNGIWNDYLDAMESTLDIANLIGADVTLVYSSNKGWNLIDAADIAIAGLKTAAVCTLASNVKKDLNNNRKVILIGHSRGAAVVQSAVESMYIQEWQGSNLAILTLGGFSKMPGKWKVPKSAMVHSYAQASSRTFDMVPFLRHELGEAFDLRIVFKGANLLLNPKFYRFAFKLMTGNIHAIKNYRIAIQVFMADYRNGRRGRNSQTLWFY